MFIFNVYVLSQVSNKLNLEVSRYIPSNLVNSHPGISPKCSDFASVILFKNMRLGIILLEHGGKIDSI